MVGCELFLLGVSVAGIYPKKSPICGGRTCRRSLRGGGGVRGCCPQAPFCVTSVAGLPGWWSRLMALYLSTFNLLDTISGRGRPHGRALTSRKQGAQAVEGSECMVRMLVSDTGWV